MTTSADEGQFLNMLIKLIGAKKTMEIGVYTGYSLLATALALPEDGTVGSSLPPSLSQICRPPPVRGFFTLSPLLLVPPQILAMDINRENYELGLPCIEKAGVAHKIDFREGPALPVLDDLIADVRNKTYAIIPAIEMSSSPDEGSISNPQEKNHGSFDFVFVDADKDNYLNYHDRLLKLVKLGGLIGYDNTLWNGSVVLPDDAPMRKYIRFYRDFVLVLNKALAADERVEICQLPVGDGVTLCRRVK